jgi:hypothetical protein
MIELLLCQYKWTKELETESQAADAGAVEITVDFHKSKIISHCQITN